MHQRQQHQQKKVWLSLFFALLTICVIAVVGAALMQEKTMNNNVDTQVDQQHTLSAAGQSFLAQYGWYTDELEQTYTRFLFAEITTYDFGNNNAIIDLSSDDAAQFKLGYEKVSSIDIQDGVVNGERVVARSIKDGAELVYASIEYAGLADGRSLIIRGSADFVDTVMSSLEFAE